MSYKSNNTVFNYADEDQNFLSTRQENKILSQDSEFSQFEPGIVLDIILDDKHPLFENGSMGMIRIPENFPPNYKNQPAMDTDNDYFSIGTVLVRLCYSHQKVEKENLIWAVPMDNSLTTFPLLNEIVSVVKYLGVYYYTNKLNVKNICNTSADFRYEPTFGKKSKNRSYSGVTLSGPESRFDSKTELGESIGFRGVLGNYFWFNDKIRNLRRFEGDTILESRFGQSIRMGSYDTNRDNDRGFYDNYKSNRSSASGGGNPMILIRNRQRPISQDNVQRQHSKLNEIPSKVDSEENVGGYLLEDVNNDGSSIHITSGLTTSNFRTTCFKSIFSKSSPEEQPKYSPVGSSPFIFPTLNGDQIVIHSDRLILASRFKETLHFSKKRYSIITDSEYTVDAHDQIVLTSNSKTVLNSPKIFLGQYDETSEPVLLGKTSIEWLRDLCNWIIEHVHEYKHSHSDAGQAEPDKTQLSKNLNSLISLRDNLGSLLSKRVFVVGGGYAPGADGGNIKN